MPEKPRGVGGGICPLAFPWGPGIQDSETPVKGSCGPQEGWTGTNGWGILSCQKTKLSQPPPT